MGTFKILQSFLFAVTFAAALMMGGCQSVTPNPQPSASPSLDVNVFDYTNRVLTDITGTRSTSSQSNPYQYSGLLKLSAETTGFDSNIGVRAHDASGVQAIYVAYQFYTCSEEGNPALLPITSFNNGATTG